MKKRSLLFSFAFIAACSGSDGSDGQTSIMNLSEEAAGEHCPYGGQRFESGVDTSANGELEDNEKSMVRYICNPASVDGTDGGKGDVGAAGPTGAKGEDGADGTDGASSLITSSIEEPGENCEAGGTVVAFGTDDDGNGTLNESEIDGSTYVCHGTHGADGATGGTGLVSTAFEPAGNNCIAGGTRIHYGIDDDGSGSLGAEEVDGTAYVCNGATGANGTAVSSLVDVTPEAPGNNCPSGGQAIRSGQDTNGNAILETSETTQIAYVCDAAG